MENTEESKSLHVAIALTPGIGHLIPLTEFAKRLVLHHPEFEVTIFIPNDGSPMKYQKQLLQALPKSISTIFLPPVSFDDLPLDVDAETKIVLSLVRSIPALKDSLKVLLESTRLVALVVDLFCIDAVYDVSKELGIKPFIFFPTNAMALQLIFHMPKYDQMFSCESYSDLVEPIELPGCVPFQGRDIPDSVREKKSVTYQGMIRLCKCFSLAAGIMVNSFMDLEKGAFKGLMNQNQKQGEFDIPPIYPVGPLVRTSSSSSTHGSNNCLRWLNEQPDGSVVYVSFGSGGTLSSQQMNELAMGLEMSGQRFIWVVKSPNDKAKNATYFGVDSVDDPIHFLPNGFLERTKGVGLVVPSWAPQVEILSHGSTGGFITHCGWNSTLEAIVHGVPLIAWPLYAEQRLNAVLLADDLKVAWRVKENENGLVGRDEIAKFVKGIIEGEEGKPLRDKMRKLKDAAKMVLSPDGSSTKSLAKVAEIWNNQGK
ncbi:UDP-glucuronosyl/UDP-glucosyltransferase [Corchorus capsularis]|uniref:Glycosyltransferase n=1 Tax=Corchorus capsularis TaxID=210143 RepID=A0A1R3IAU2_COCAP|nr:UDP-glucuronosyl/UDP-glucosyltransferase [Corchorus capsularis]